MEKIDGNGKEFGKKEIPESDGFDLLLTAILYIINFD